MRVGVEVQFLSITVLVLAAFVLGSKDNKEIVHPGTAVLVPRGTLHSFESLDENSKLLVIYTPGGWEHYYRESIELTLEQRKDEDFMKQFNERHDEYDW